MKFSKSFYKSGFSLFILTICALGCSLFSSKTGDAEAVFATTEVGTPEGEKVTRHIGPAGGTLSSPDGRLTLTVPPAVLTETITLSIQPVTNKAGGGLGLAYRLEPSGKTFTTPVQIAVHYDDHDLQGTVPAALSIAYQDERGAWHEQKSLSQTVDTFTVATTHFSDWAFLVKMRLSPATATVAVGERLSIVLLGCAQPKLTFWEKLYKVKGDTYSDPDLHCRFGTMDKVPYRWLVDIGTIEDGVNPVWYTAPQKKPTPNVATIVFPYSAVDQHAWTKDDSSRKGMFTSQITIVDRGYRATGKPADVDWSGAICSLEKPFTVSGSVINYKLNFTPSSPTGGTAAIAGAGMSVVAMGSGTYKVEGADTDKPRIALTQSTVGHSPVGSRTGNGTIYIDLVPLETNEGN